MPGTLNRMKSFFKREKEAAPIAPSPMPAISDVHALPFVRSPPIAPPQQRLFEKHPKQPQPAPVQCITAQQIRELRELIRYRYSLDIGIWHQRGVKEFKRDRLKENMRRSDAALEVIRSTLLEWDRREFFASDIEHQKFIDIKNRLLKGQKANWAKHPPWEFVHHGGDPYSGPWEKYGQPINGVPQTTGTQRPNQQYASESVNEGARTEPQRYAMKRTPNHFNDSRRSSRQGQPTAVTSRHAELGVAHSVRTSRAPSTRAHSPFDGNGTPAQSHRSPKYRVASPVDSHHAPTLSDGNGIPVVKSPVMDTRSRRPAWEAQLRVTGPQWQHEPVEHARADEQDEQSARLRRNQ